MTTISPAATLPSSKRSGSSRRARVGLRVVVKLFVNVVVMVGVLFTLVRTVKVRVGVITSAAEF